MIACSIGNWETATYKSPSITGILLDLEVSGIQGMSTLKYIKKLHPYLPIVAQSLDENVMGLVCTAEEEATDYYDQPPLSNSIPT